MREAGHAVRKTQPGVVGVCEVKRAADISAGQEQSMRNLDDLRPFMDELAASCSNPMSYGFSDLDGLLPEALRAYPRAVTLALRLDDALIDSIRGGPHAAYYAEYKRVNALLDDLSGRIVEDLRSAGHAAHAIASAQRVDFVNILGEFPHKTGAVRSGLGWIGRSSLLVTRAYGPRLRLGTVLTDLALGTVPEATQRPFCGSCALCVEACPAGAIKGEAWQPGLERSALLDAKGCEDWKKEHYPQFDGMICGICVAVCPHGRPGQAAKARG